MTAKPALQQNYLAAAVAALVFISGMFFLGLYVLTGSIILFAFCCVPVGLAFAALLAVGLSGALKKQAFRGDVL